MTVTKADVWTHNRACRGMNPGIFIPRRGANIDKRAIAACAGCPVRDACADWGVTHLTRVQDVGYWGGTTPQQRRKLKAARRAAGQDAA